jgi:hypothetical protein
MIFLHLITIFDTVIAIPREQFLIMNLHLGMIHADPLLQNLTDFTVLEPPSPIPNTVAEGIPRPNSWTKVLRSFLLAIHTHIY